MALRDLKARTILFAVLGWAITLLFIMGFTSIWKRNFVPALWYIGLGIGLTIVFFYKRMTALGLIASTFLLLNAGLTTLFHPSVPGFLLVVGSSVALYLIVQWRTRRFPNLNPKDWQTTLFK